MARQLGQTTYILKCKKVLEIEELCGSPNFLTRLRGQKNVT